MSAKSHLRPYTSETSPRQGGKPGRRAKLSAAAVQILDRLMVDWAKHGANTLKILRTERPDLYARLALETAARLTLAEMDAADAGGPMILTVRWGEPKQLPAPPPPPPEKPWTEPSPTAPPPPPMTQPSPPRVLTLLPRSPA